MKDDDDRPRAERAKLSAKGSQEGHSREVRRGQELWKQGESRADRVPERADRGVAKDARDAWNRPGTFHPERDSEGRTTRIEGWLSLRNDGRGSAEHRVQENARQKHGMGPGVDSGHILGYAIGGPAADQCSSELAAANQLPMDARINRSQYAGVEKQLRELLSQGKNIYAEATVHYDPQAAGKTGPRSVEFRFFEMGAGGVKQPLDSITSILTRVDLNPARTTGQAVKQAELGTAGDFYSARRGGAHGTQWTDGH